jgi:hypothetical protein
MHRKAARYQISRIKMKEKPTIPLGKNISPMHDRAGKRHADFSTL